MLRYLLDKFWDEDIWLPPNTTWDDLAPGPDKPVVLNDHTHLLYPIPLALVLIIIRHMLEKYWFAPFGKSLGIKNTRSKRAPNNPKLEAAYQASSKIRHKQFYLSEEQVCGLAKQLDMTERQVERWWRLRRSQDKPSTLVKFCENSWRCIFYLYNFSYGLFVLWDKVWFWEIDQCYVGYPYHGITNDIWWYYMISTAFYWSLTISQFWDVRRKDFWQMFVHHITTIALLSFSWVCNMHRIGTLVLVIHDCADILLDAAKATKYANYQKLCDTLFAVFTLVWIITRLGIFPFYIIWSTAIRAPMLHPMFPAYYIFNSLLCLMLGLHLVWTWLILQVAYKAITAGKLDGDIRSSSSELSDSSHLSNHSTPSRAQPHANAHTNANTNTNANANTNANNHKDK
ncbi:PREDICTED: ceramide synthase 6 isoform X1 [Papilio polytes]|uniref:ceramide synthase 6 isoform X1 n=1 Tax=Papilio polytes TaxID=76194 RepID=UPI0006761E2B|nr:PREDICTED: ceramide synthase 6 isoform X1 [Papilio polytes]